MRPGRSGGARDASILAPFYSYEQGVFVSRVFEVNKREVAVWTVAACLMLLAIALPGRAAATLITPHAAAPASVTPQVITPAPAPAPAPAPSPQITVPSLPPSQAAPAGILHNYPPMPTGDPSGTAKNWGKDPADRQPVSDSEWDPGAHAPMPGNSVPHQDGEAPRPDVPQDSPNCHEACHLEWAHWSAGETSRIEALRDEILPTLSPTGAIATLVDSSSVLASLTPLTERLSQLANVYLFGYFKVEDEGPFESFVYKGVDVASLFSAPATPPPGTPAKTADAGPSGSSGSGDTRSADASSDRAGDAGCSNSTGPDVSDDSEAATSGCR
jgi:hypothetical protein